MKWNIIDIKHTHWKEHDLEQEYESSLMINGMYFDVIKTVEYGGKYVIHI